MSKLTPSVKAQNTTNPIRKIVDSLVLPKDHPKSFINLALGDPTIHGNLDRPEVLTEAMNHALKDCKIDGYGPSTGLAAAKNAIAAYSSSADYTVTDNEVIIASGCSGALELVLSVLINPGDNILVPKPGFPLYQVITRSLLGDVQFYDLIEENNWECDLVQMESLINDKTKAILINNPSNPCGSNFSKEHLINVVALAKKYNLPIIADEIYANVVFEGEFTPIHTVCGDVPILHVSGLAKQFVVPGWRVGWLVVYDRSENKVASELLLGLKSLSQLIIGATSIVQACIPTLLTKDKESDAYKSLQEFSERYLSILRVNSQLAFDQVQKVNKAVREQSGATDDILTISKSTGAMYTMIGLNIEMFDETVNDDADFARRILIEENLSLLPGQAFTMKNYVRLVISCPPHVVEEVFGRIQSFCLAHIKK